MFEYKFKRVDFVTEPGEFSVRGGIVDVFSFSNDEPYRIEFFGDDVDSIRTFDVESQLSTDKVNKITIIPNVADKFLEEKREGFLKYIAAETSIFIKNTDFLLDRLDDFFQKAGDAFQKLSKEVKHAEPEALFMNSIAFGAHLKEFGIVSMGTPPPSNANINEELNFNTKPQPSFNKKFNLLLDDLNAHKAKGYTNYIFCASEQQAKRFHAIFEDVSRKVHYETRVMPLYQGFIDDDLKIVCYTDHQIFERYHKFHLKNGYAKKQAITLKELNKLEIGDYVTHIDHGIGKFGGGYKKLMLRQKARSH